MKLLMVADGLYYVTPNGTVYVQSVFDYNFYSRYLSAFDEVYAIVRAKEVNDVPIKCKIASGKGVHFLTVPQAIGIKQYITLSEIIKEKICSYCKHFDVALFRVPGIIANIACKEFDKTGKPYALEVVVDPWEYFAKGTTTGITRPYIRYSWTAFLKKMCKRANGVSYVTSSYLQNKYPCKAILEKDEQYFTASYSSVELPDDSFANPRIYQKKDRYVISHVANSFSGYGKGHITLMKATQKVLSHGYNIDIWFIGDGPLRRAFENYAINLGIYEHVSFLGSLPNGSAVREKIKQSDMFVFPTMAEGLPRVLLEAMAEGLPCLSSPVCGIPEILSKSCLIEFNDVDGYAQAIEKLIDSPLIMTELSAKNIEVALHFKSSLLNVKRESFYSELANSAEGSRIHE